MRMVRGGLLFQEQQGGTGQNKWVHEEHNVEMEPVIGALGADRGHGRERC